MEQDQETSSVNSPREYFLLSDAHDEILINPQNSNIQTFPGSSELNHVEVNSVISGYEVKDRYFVRDPHVYAALGMLGFDQFVRYEVTEEIVNDYTNPRNVSSYSMWDIINAQNQQSIGLSFLESSEHIKVNSASEEERKKIAVEIGERTLYFNRSRTYIFTFPEENSHFDCVIAEIPDDPSMVRVCFFDEELIETLRDAGFSVEQPKDGVPESVQERFITFMVAVYDKMLADIEATP